MRKRKKLFYLRTLEISKLNLIVMKKTIMLVAAALLMVGGVSAQKQTGGEKNLEVNFAPLGGNPISIGGIKFRTFTSENSALRLNLFVGSSSDKTVTAQEGELSFEDPTSPALYSWDRSFDLTIRPGYEIHFDGTDRLSPYVGAELDLGFGNVSTEDEYWGPNDVDNIGEDGNNVVWTTTDKTGYFRFGINLLAGFDFYFADNIYLGGELGFGFSSMNMGDSTLEVSDQTAYNLEFTGDPDADLPADVENGSTFNVGPNVNGAIRLGYLFN